MAAGSSSQKREKRHATRHPGITYRVNADGSRTYSVNHEPNRKLGKSPYVKAGKTEEEALAKQAELRGKKFKGEKIILPSKLTYEQVANEWWECPNEKLRPRYRDEKEARRQLEETISEWGEDVIGGEDVEAIFELDAKWEKEGRSESTRANYFKPARRVFDFAVFKSYIAVSPFAQAPRGSLPSCNVQREHFEWTTQDYERFIRVGHERGLRPEARRKYGLQIEMKMRLGPRLGELSGLHCSDIDREAKVAHIRGQWTKYGKYVPYTKTKASTRRVPLTDELIAKINFRQAFLGLSDDDFLFADRPGGNPPSHSNFRRRGWNPVVEATGLRIDADVKVTPHDSRHAFVSQLREGEDKLDSTDVAALVGHASSAITERIYEHSFNREEREERIRAKMRAAHNGVSRED
jgi:integrase